MEANERSEVASRAQAKTNVAMLDGSHQIWDIAHDEAVLEAPQECQHVPDALQEGLAPAFGNASSN